MPARTGHRVLPPPRRHPPRHQAGEPADQSGGQRAAPLRLRLRAHDERRLSTDGLRRHPLVPSPGAAPGLHALRQGRGRLGPGLHHGRAHGRAAALRGRVRGGPALRHPEGAGPFDCRAHGDVPEEPPLPRHTVPGREPAGDAGEALRAPDAEAADGAAEGRPGHGAPAAPHGAGRPADALVRGHQAAALPAAAVAVAVANTA
mmetsp:Transcript_9227/g.28571  ORF Transcript_9227/g.28571 Transcript_9227/m.28571 type:complete len:203 (-) Transcript_9227:47-655(-)